MWSSLQFLFSQTQKEVSLNLRRTGSLWYRQSQQSFQYVNSPLFFFSLTTCFGAYGPSSGEIYNWMFQWTAL
jgi:hypothetical protein